MNLVIHIRVPPHVSTPAHLLNSTENKRLLAGKEVRGTFGHFLSVSA